MLFRVEGLTKAYAGRPVFMELSFTVDEGELVSLIGPSGAGKTTLLKVLAGLERADRGLVSFTRPPSKQNPVIMVFQDYLLFPSMSVFDNVAFGLVSRRVRRDEITARVGRMLEFFQLTELAAHYPNQLSAGQKQRVAIARAMVVEPSLLLLDEPFANLDPALKLSTAEFIRATQKTFGTTTISVTHDLPEAFVMSDRVGVILDGRLKQLGAPNEVYTAPVDYETAAFLGPVNRLTPLLRARLELPEPETGSDQATTTRYARPEALRLTKVAASPARVQAVSFAGSSIRYQVAVGEREDAGETALLTVYSLADGLEVGDPVRVEVLAYLPRPDAENGGA